MTCQVIFNADDFGLCTQVNEGIQQAFESGLLTSTSIMPNANQFDEAVRIAESCPDLDIGIHLSLVAEKPLLDLASATSLIDNNGYFHADIATFVKKYLLGQINLQEVRAEIEAQFEKTASRLGKAISHVDSHQHAHVLPEIRNIVCDVAKQYGVNYIRKPAEAISTYMLRDATSYPRLAQQQALNGFCAKGDWPKQPNQLKFKGFYFGGNLSEDNLQTVINSIKDDACYEIMCHPANGSLPPPYSQWGYQSNLELLALQSDIVREAIERKNITVCGFSNLHKN